MDLTLCQRYQRPKRRLKKTREMDLSFIMSMGSFQGFIILRKVGTHHALSATGKFRKHNLDIIVMRVKKKTKFASICTSYNYFFKTLQMKLRLTFLENLERQ